MALIFIFIDGVGLGDGNEQNPFYADSYPSFELLTGGKFIHTAKPVISDNHVFKPIDANLGVEGLPQSGTGQTTLFTGVNAAELIGKHFGPFPHSGIKHLLTGQSIFHDVLAKGKKACFLNAYPPVFFELSERRNRWSCTTLMAKSAGLKLNSTEDVLNETALTAEIIQDAWREQLNIPIPEITAAQAGRRLLKAAADTDFLLYEYYLTDKAGHSQSADKARRVLRPLDEFLMEIISNKKKNDLLIITSDHGNLEDLSTKSHTRNKVPFFVLGEGASHFSHIESLQDVKAAIIGFI